MNELLPHDHTEYYALCIGMDQWSDHATTMGDLFALNLHYRRDHVHVLNEGNGPTKRQVLDSIASFQQRDSSGVSVGPKDVFVFYYVGHGDVDGSGNFLFRTQDGSLSQSELMDAVMQLHVLHAVFIIDACHAAAFTASFKASRKNMRIAVLAGALEDELLYKSYAKSLQKHSKAMIRERACVHPYFLAQRIDGFVFNSHQWEGMSIGPLFGVGSNNSAFHCYLPVAINNRETIDSNCFPMVLRTPPPIYNRKES